MKTLLVTGANRGIGLELVRALVARGDRVHATARNPSAASELSGLAAEHANLKLHALDVTSEDSVRTLGEALANDSLDVLLNNAGVASSWAGLSAVTSAELLRVYDTNAVGPIRVTRALLEPLTRAKGKVFHLSSRMGSIGDNQSGGAYAYRMSKAALNMASVTLAHELRPLGVASIVLHPGWVKTDMGGPSAPIEASTSASALVKVIDEKGLAQTGGFFDQHGRPLPW